MKTLFLLALATACQAQSNRIVWDSVKTLEGEKLFDLLHGRYMTLDRTPSTLIQGATVSFSPQGASVLSDLAGKRISGIGIDALMICSPAGAPISGGSIYKTASQQGISWISPTLAGPMLRKTAARSAPSLLFSAATYASLGIPVLGQAKVISMSSKFVIGLLSGHALFDSFKSQIQYQVPDPSAFLATLLDPETSLTFAGGCRESRMVVGWHKNPIAGTFPILP